MRPLRRFAKSNCDARFQAAAQRVANSNEHANRNAMPLNCPQPRPLGNCLPQSLRPLRLPTNPQSVHTALCRTLTGVLSVMLAGWISVAVGSTSEPPLTLETLSTRDGSPQGNIMVTLQDSQGFVWLGTEDGLVRFDGHEIYRYSYSP